MKNKFRDILFRKMLASLKQAEKDGKDITKLKEIIKGNISIYKEMPEYAEDVEFKAYIDSIEND